MAWNDPIVADTPWTGNDFVQPYWRAHNHRRSLFGTAHGPEPIPGAHIQYGGTTAPAYTNVTSITRAGSTATATTTTTHGATTGDKYVIEGAAETEYNGTHDITVTGTTTFTFEVTGTPSSPATGTIKGWNLTRMGFSPCVLQAFLESRCTSFVDPSIEFHEAPLVGSWAFTLATFRVAAGIHASGFYRQRPREINSTTAATDSLGNARVIWQKAWMNPLLGTPTAARGKLHEFNGTSWVQTHSAKSVSSLTRSGTTATATITAHGWSSTVETYIQIAGASPASYNGKKLVTYVDANTVTFEVPNTLTSPATGTITATKLVHGPVDTIASDLAAPNNVPYGLHEVGDRFTERLWTEIRDGFNQLIWLYRSGLSLVSKVTMAGAGVDPDYGTALAEAESAFTSYGGGNTILSRNATTLDGDYTITLVAHEAKLRVGTLNVNMPASEVDFYGFAQDAPSPGTPPSGGESFTYDDQGLGYTPDIWNLLDTVSRAGATATTTLDTTATMGTSAIPNPAPVPGAASREVQGYELAEWRAVIRFDVTGGFDQIPDP